MPRKLLRRSVLLLVFVMLGLSLLDSSPSAVADDDGCNLGGNNNPFNRPDGMLVQGPGTPFYLVEDCARRQIVWYEDYLSYRFAHPVVGVSSAEINDGNMSPNVLRGREGTILSNAGNLYIVDEISPGSYQRRYIEGTAWTPHFGSCGYTTAHMQTVSSAVINSYAPGPNVTSSSLRPDGMLLINNQDGKVYLVAEGQKRRYITGTGNPTPYFENLTSHDFNRPSCPVNQSVINSYSPQIEDLKAREGTLVRITGTAPVYIIERAPGHAYWKRWVLSSDAFIYYGMSSTAVKDWPAARVNGYQSTVTAHPIKTVHSDQWAFSLLTTDLRWHKGYDQVPPDTVPVGSWDPQINAAVTSWNAAPISADFNEYPISGSNHVQVSVIVIGQCPAGIGGQTVPQYAGGLIARVFVELYHNCTPPSQRLVAHELSHSLRLDHDGMNGPATGDNACGPPRVPQTIMDYDCYQTGPLNWDFCGVNHKHEFGDLQLVGC